MKSISLAAAALLALSAAACASNGNESASASRTATSPAQTQAAPESTQPTQSSPQAQAEPSATPTAPSAPGAAQGSYTDTQLRGFLAANREITALTQRHQAHLQGTAEQQAAARAQMQTEAVPILQRHNIDTATYNQIAAAARTDEALAQRLTALSAPSAN